MLIDAEAHLFKEEAIAVGFGEVFNGEDDRHGVGSRGEGTEWSKV